MRAKDSRWATVGARGADGRFGASVFLDVTIEVRLLAKAALAQRAPEGLLLVVNVADVSLEIGRDAEAASTVLTPVWLLPGMRSQVARQISGTREHLAAVATRVPVTELGRSEGE